MNTFFFGYLSPKWKRLARVLSFLFLPLFPLLIEEKTAVAMPLITGIIIHIVLVAIVSYTLKPFINKN